MSVVGWGRPRPRESVDRAEGNRTPGETRQHSARDSSTMKRCLVTVALFALLSAVSVTAAIADCDPLVVRDTTLDRGDYGIRIVGEAIHHADEPLEDLTLSFALYKRGEGVGGASADRAVLESGDTWNFAARTSTDDFDGYRLAAKFCSRTSGETDSGVLFTPLLAHLPPLAAVGSFRRPGCPSEGVRVVGGRLTFSCYRRHGERPDPHGIQKP